MAEPTPSLETQIALVLLEVKNIRADFEKGVQSLRELFDLKLSVLDNDHTELHEKHEALEKRVTLLEEAKNKIHGAWIFLALVAGGVLTFLGSIIANKIH